KCYLGLLNYIYSVAANTTITQTGSLMFAMRNQRLSFLISAEVLVVTMLCCPLNSQVPAQFFALAPETTYCGVDGLWFSGNRHPGRSLPAEWRGSLHRSRRSEERRVGKECGCG